MNNTVILSIIIGLVLWAITYFYNQDSDIPLLGSFFESLFFTGIIILCLFICSENSSINEEWRITKSIPIYSLERDQMIEGQFILGGGSVDSYPVYFFYKQIGQAYYLTHVDADNTPIYEGNYTPCVRLKQAFSHGGLRGFLKGSWFSIDTSAYPTRDQSQWQLFVPNGTIVKQFKL